MAEADKPRRIAPWSRTSKQGWQCAAIEVTSGGHTPEYPHLCTLPKDHWGRHLCWCGWAFRKVDGQWQQPDLF